MAERGIEPTPGRRQRGREFVLWAEQKGIKNVNVPPAMREVLGDFERAHVYANQLTFGLMGLVAIVGAVVSWLLVRKTDHELPTHIFSRRSRWRWATSGQGPGLTRKPPPDRTASEKPTE